MCMYLCIVMLLFEQREVALWLGWGGRNAMFKMLELVMSRGSVCRLCGCLCQFEFILVLAAWMRALESFLAPCESAQSKLRQSYMLTTLALETWAIYQIIYSTS